MEQRVAEQRRRVSQVGAAIGAVHDAEPIVPERERREDAAQLARSLAGAGLPLLASRSAGAGGAPGRARGTIVHLRGSVRTVYGVPITGRYDHPDDDNPAPLDPCFQYWGRALTESEVATAS